MEDKIHILNKRKKNDEIPDEESTDTLRKDGNRTEGKTDTPCNESNEAAIRYTKYMASG
ncbi:hypothetical protein CHS0354_008667, partial [Potamilus streckersoni]